MNRRVGGVYIIFNIYSGKSYIGSSKDLKKRIRIHKRRLKINKHENPHLQRAWEKYGWNAFIFKPLLICAEKDLLMYEQTCMDHFKPAYNISIVAGAPMRGRRMSAESKLKMSNARRGVPKSLAHRIAMSAAQKGRIITAEARVKISETLKLRNLHTKQIHSAETKAKISAGNKGKKRTPEQRARLSEIVKAQWRAKRAIQ